jgi:hypothetical protein
MVSKQRVCIGHGSRRVARRPGAAVVPGSADDAAAAVHKLIRKLAFVAQYWREAGLTDNFA